MFKGTSGGVQFKANRNRGVFYRKKHNKIIFTACELRWYYQEAGLRTERIHQGDGFECALNCGDTSKLTI